MIQAVVLDSGPLGLVSNARSSQQTQDCLRWMQDMMSHEIELYIPEIADYEVRRELLRADKTQGIRRLNHFQLILGYLPITTDVMVKAAEFWAMVRKQGVPTADDKALDGDVILAAQVFTFQQQCNINVVVATTNTKHLSLFVPSMIWQNIVP